VKESDLQQVFDAFASFGLGTIHRPEKVDMDGAKFAKMCRESGLLCSRFSTTSVDLIFSKVKAKVCPTRMLIYRQPYLALSTHPPPPTGPD
jgi:p25-alpha